MWHLAYNFSDTGWSNSLVFDKDYTTVAAPSAGTPLPWTSNSSSTFNGTVNNNSPVISFNSGGTVPAASNFTVSVRVMLSRCREGQGPLEVPCFEYPYLTLYTIGSWSPLAAPASPPPVTVNCFKMYKTACFPCTCASS